MQCPQGHAQYTNKHPLFLSHSYQHSNQIIMSSSSAQTPSGPSADKLLLSQGAANVHAWTRALHVSLDLYPCPASDAILEGSDRTPAAKPLPTLLDTVDGKDVYKHKADGSASDAVATALAGDIVAAKKDLADLKKINFELLKHVHATVSQSSLQLAADDKFYAGRRGDVASLVSSLIRLHNAKDRAEIIATLKELSDLKEVAISGDEDNSGRALANRVRAAADSMTRNFGDSIPVAVLASATLINGLDPDLHKQFLVYLTHQVPTWSRGQSVEDAEKAFEALVAGVIRECKSYNKTATGDADSRGSALALAAVGEPAAAQQAGGRVECATCVAAKQGEPRLRIGATDHQAGTKDCPMQRKLFGLLRIKSGTPSVRTRRRPPAKVPGRAALLRRRH